MAAIEILMPGTAPSASQQAWRVAPVVITSSTRRIRAPSSRAGRGT